MLQSRLIAGQKLAQPALDPLELALESRAEIIRDENAGSANMRVLITRTKSIREFFNNLGLILPQPNAKELRNIPRGQPFNFQGRTPNPLIVTQGYVGQNAPKEYYHLHQAFKDDARPEQAQLSYTLSKTDADGKPLRELFTLTVTATSKMDIYRVHGVNVSDTVDAVTAEKYDPSRIKTSEIAVNANEQFIIRAFIAACTSTEPWLYLKVCTMPNIGMVTSLEGTIGLPKGVKPTGSVQKLKSVVASTDEQLAP